MLPLVEKVELNPGIVRELKKNPSWKLDSYLDKLGFHVPGRPLLGDLWASLLSKQGERNYARQR